MARRRAWAPPRGHEARPPSLAQFQSDGVPSGATWSTNPNHHAAIYRPRCSVAGCREPAMIWQRHGCRQFIARCHAHDPTDSFAAARAAHTCSGAPCVLSTSA